MTWDCTLGQILEKSFNGDAGDYANPQNGFFVVVLKTRMNERWLGYPASSGSNALCGINRTSVAAFSIGSNTMEHWKN